MSLTYSQPWILQATGDTLKRIREVKKPFVCCYDQSMQKTDYHVQNMQFFHDMYSNDMYVSVCTKKKIVNVEICIEILPQNSFFVLFVKIELFCTPGVCAVCEWAGMQRFYALRSIPWVVQVQYTCPAGCLYTKKSVVMWG